MPSVAYCTPTLILGASIPFNAVCPLQCLPPASNEKSSIKLLWLRFFMDSKFFLRLSRQAFLVCFCLVCYDLFVNLQIVGNPANFVNFYLNYFMMG